MKLIDQASDENGYPGGQCGFINNGFCPPGSNYDFNHMFYCTFSDAFGDSGMYISFFIVGGFLIFVGMYLLSDTADAYLSPCLEFITERLICNESLAGVTLLAFGNGAPDVFGSIAAAGDPDSNSTLDANQPVCILIGGTFFICTVVIFLTARATNINPDPKGIPDRRIKVTP